MHIYINGPSEPALWLVIFNGKFFLSSGIIYLAQANSCPGKALTMPLESRSAEFYNLP